MSTGQPLLVRAWNQCSRLWPGATASFPDAKKLFAAAAATAGWEDIGDAHCLEGLDRLLRDFNRQGGFHAFGRFYVGQFLHGLLVQRLRLARLWSVRPDILATPIERPLVIIGLPRSGTSFLFNLLARDPAHRYLANWEASVSQLPPRRRRRDPRDDPRRRQGRMLLAFQKYLMPDIERQHAFLLDGPEECTPLLMQGFATQALVGMFDVPEYSRWLDGADRRPTYSHHRRVLQTLQWTYPGQRWLLKSPDHMGALDALLETYPDACIVCTHRNPVSAVASWASLAHSFRSIYYERPDPGRIGQQALERLARDAEALARVRETVGADSVLDIAFEVLVARPEEVVRDIYRHFGLPLTDEAMDTMRAFLAGGRGFETGRHRYRPEDFGLTEAGISERFASYRRRFAGLCSAAKAAG